MSAPVTHRQLGAIHGHLGKLGVTDPAEKRAVLSALIFRPLTSTKELTTVEARTVLLTLDEITTREQLDKVIAAGQRWLARSTT